MVTPLLGAVYSYDVIMADEVLADSIACSVSGNDLLEQKNPGRLLNGVIDLDSALVKDPTHMVSLVGTSTPSGFRNGIGGNSGGPLFPGPKFAVGDRPYNATTGHFNGDGIIDLVTANVLSDDVSVLLGLGDGAFAPEQRFAVEDGPWSVTTGDFNGDGFVDLAMANKYSGDVSVLLNLTIEPSIVVVPPDSFEITRGQFVSGTIADLTNSEGSDLSAQRRVNDVQSRVVLEVKSTSPTENPTKLTFTVGASVFARSTVTQSIDLFNFVT